ncbi:hypothetical protein BJ1_gp01 [Halorubrum virus BJ1]|uniref:Uncharacterized protein n=1 Tax=Halorubrum virus BJ1 TaxID=416419 RepID=A0ZYL4_9CAUD|nr:hypothetical protein BJ1_gp01 [Halorubrum virus BJ1]CAL92423.1 hypothetical protein [Halorubrum virus BJ1]
MTLNVCYIAGGDSWVPCYISAYSVLENNQDLDIHMYILSEEDNNNPFFEHVEYLYESHPSLEIEFIEVDMDQFDDLPAPGKHLSPGVYFKIAINRLLPTDGNVLLLDADTICDGSLSSLLSLDLSGKVLAAAPSNKAETVRLGLQNNRAKFNAGVLYVNLQEWAKQDIEERSRQYIEEHEPELNDQDALNALVNNPDDMEYIHPRYNATKLLVREFEMVDDEPTIIHYNGPDKPWRFVTERESGDLWWEYASKTPFRDYVPKDKGVKEIIFVRARSAMRRFGIYFF